MIELTAYRGDSMSFTIPLTNGTAAFTPGGSYSLIFTAKRSSKDPDTAAVFQKSTATGTITTSTTNAIVTVLYIDTTTEDEPVLYWDIQAQHNSTAAVITAAKGTLTLVRDITRQTTASVPIYTVDPAAGGGGATPAGSTGSVQINNSGALAADSGLVYTGTGNTGVLKIGGGSVIMSDPTVSQNVAIGGGNPTLPFANRTTGNYNTVVGTNSLPLLTTGSGNVAIGTSTLSALLGGNNNVGVGVNALTAVTSGSGNVSLGNGAGAYITTGSDNICIGGSGNPVGITNVSSISIGSTGDGSRTTVIGIAGDTATTKTRLVGDTLILGHASTITSRTSLVQSASGAAKTITLPNADGIVPVFDTLPIASGKVLTSSGVLGAAVWADSTAGGTVDATIIDGSTNAVSGNAVFDALTNKAPTASPTLTGTLTATGQISSSGSTDATVSTNVVNVATNDARYSGPKFSAYSNANQLVPTATFTKILYPLTDFNTAGYSTANSRFTPGKAGYYLLTVGARPQTNANSSIFYVYKNGAQLKAVLQDSNHAAVNRAACLIVNANATDYFEVFCWHNKGTDLMVEHNQQTNGFFQATFIP